MTAGINTFPNPETHDEVDDITESHENDDIHVDIPYHASTEEP